MASSKKARTSLLTHNGYQYATLDFTPPDKTTGGTQSTYITIVTPWELAPNEPDIVNNVIANHPWGASIMLVAGGVGYFTANKPIGSRGKKVCSSFVTLRQEGEDAYKVESALPHRDIRVLMRMRSVPTADPPHIRCSELVRGMWERKVFTDCDVVCSDKVLPCHRAVLAQASPVFDRMLSSEMEEAKEKRVVIRDAEPHVVEAMVTFMYTGELTCKDDDVVALLALADCYQMASLVRECADKAVASVNENNVLIVLRAVRTMRGKPGMDSIVDELVKKVHDTPLLFSAIVGSV